MLSWRCGDRPPARRQARIRSRDFRAAPLAAAARSCHESLTDAIYTSDGRQRPPRPACAVVWSSPHPAGARGDAGDARGVRAGGGAAKERRPSVGGSVDGADPQGAEPALAGVGSAAARRAGRSDRATAAIRQGSGGLRGGGLDRFAAAAVGACAGRVPGAAGSRREGAGAGPGDNIGDAQRAYRALSPGAGVLPDSTPANGGRDRPSTGGARAVGSAAAAG